MTIEETKSKMDVLFSEIKAYRKSTHFQELLYFCAHFKTLAPYNAMLIHLQRPHAHFVLTASEWKKYNRKVRAHARPLVILIPFGPVDFVFEIQDTYTPKQAPYEYSPQEIIDDVEKPFRVSGRVDSAVLDRLTYFMQYHGVAYDPNLEVGADCGGQIEELLESDEYKPLNIQINKNVDVVSRARFLISTNKYADDGQRIASIVHELGHLFCHHVPSPKGWGNAWEHRKLEIEVKEFEAEAVARIVCDRLGIAVPSERYLTPYLMSRNEIPHQVSVENICFAANKILTMCYGPQKMTYRDGLLFKHDEKFQELVKSIKSKKNN